MTPTPDDRDRALTEAERIMLHRGLMMALPGWHHDAVERLFAEHAALLAVARAAAVIAEREKAMIELRVGRRWRNFISPHDAALIDALAALPPGLFDKENGDG